MPDPPIPPSPGVLQSAGLSGRFLPRILQALVIGLLASALPGGAGEAPAAPAPPEINFYAAASLRDALQRIAPGCERALGVRLIFNFGASSDLARQIEAAGKADVFFSADEEWMDYLAGKGLVDAASRRSFLSNRLVVVGPRGSSLRIGSARDLASGGIRRIALANPESVPAGKYARRWLERAGEWKAVKDRIVPAIDVRAALAAVESGAVQAGVVYRTDVALSRNVRVLYDVPESDAPRILYALAALRERDRLEKSRKVVGRLAASEAAKIFREMGFIFIAREEKP